MAPLRGCWIWGRSGGREGKAELPPGCKCTLGRPGAARLKPGSWRKKYSPKQARKAEGALAMAGGIFTPNEGQSPGSVPGLEVAKEKGWDRPRRTGIENSRGSHFRDFPPSLVSPPASPPHRNPSPCLPFPQIVETRKKGGRRRRNPCSPQVLKPAELGPRPVLRGVEGDTRQPAALGSSAAPATGQHGANAAQVGEKTAFK